MFVSGKATILHADLDAFFASVEQRDNPRLRGQPVIVGGGVVLAASYEAKAYGIETAMGGRRARQLCPDAVVVPPRMSAYAEASKAVYRVFDDMSPLVEGLSIDEAFLDVRGMERIAGTPVEIAERLRQRVLGRGRPPAHGGRSADEVPGEGGERGREAGRPTRRAAGPRAGVPPSAPDRAPVGRRAGDVGEAPRARDRDGGPGRVARREGARLDARPGRGPPPARAGPQPRPEAGPARPPPSIDRLAASNRPLENTEGAARDRSRSSMAWSTE